MPHTMETLINQIKAWGRTRDDIRALIIVGSQARQDRPADRWSDLDLVIVTSSPDYYLQQETWLSEIALPLMTFIERTASGNGHERRVLFEGALDVDFVPISPAILVQAIHDPGTQMTLRRGYRVLLDKDNFTDQFTLPDTPPPAPQPPTAEEFTLLQNDFWYHAIWTLKKLRRGENLMALDCLNGYMKRLLYRMTEWHAQSKHGMEYDVWFNGRFFEQWADARIVQELAETYAHYEEKDIQNALVETVHLFRWIALEVSENWQLPYAHPADHFASNWIASNLR